MTLLAIECSCTGGGEEGGGGGDGSGSEGKPMYMNMNIRFGIVRRMRNQKPYILDDFRLPTTDV